MASTTDKTKGMLITTYKKNHLDEKCTVYYANTLLENVDSVKLLGVHVNKYLTWKDQFTKTA